MTTNEFDLTEKDEFLKEYIKFGDTISAMNEASIFDEKKRLILLDKDTFIKAKQQYKKMMAIVEGKGDRLFSQKIMKEVRSIMSEGEVYLDDCKRAMEWSDFSDWGKEYDFDASC